MAKVYLFEHLLGNLEDPKPDLLIGTVLAKLPQELHPIITKYHPWTDLFTCKRPNRAGRLSGQMIYQRVFSFACDSPYGIDFAPNGDAVVSAGDRTIKVFSPEGQLLRSFPICDYASGVSVGGNGNIAAHCGGRVYLYTPEGQRVMTIPEEDGIPRNGESANAIVDENGNYFIVNSPFIEVYNEKGKLVRKFTNETETLRTSCMAMDMGDILSVSDHHSTLFDSLGRIVQENPLHIGDDIFGDEHHNGEKSAVIYGNDDGYLVLALSKPGVIKVIDSSYGLVAAVFGEGQVMGPRGLAVDLYARIWVVEASGISVWE